MSGIEDQTVSYKKELKEVKKKIREQAKIIYQLLDDNKINLRLIAIREKLEDSTMDSHAYRNH